jgi:kynurenine formamidase
VGWAAGRGWGWSWGADDERGALNAITPESIVAALHGVAVGRVFDLGVPVDRGSFLAPPHVRTEVVAFRTPEGLAKDGSFPDTGADRVSFNTSLLVLSDHVGTHLDGLCHATSGADRHWYNGYTAAEHGTDFGPTKAAADAVPPIIAPGVLLDIPAVQGVPELPERYPIGVDDLTAALDRQRVDIQPGDVVLVRTGTLRHWGADGTDHERLAKPDSSGLTLAAARWLVETKGAMLIGADNSTVEVLPPVDGTNVSPVHTYLLVDQGVHMGELHFLEELAAVEAYRFCYIALLPKLRGTTGGFALRPIALV